MTRATSAEAYREIRDNGLLSRRRWEVYDYVFNHGPVTAKRAWSVIAPKSNSGVITTRFSELARLGVVAEVGETVDEDTGMTAILWDVTADLPRKLGDVEKAPTRGELLRALCALTERALCGLDVEEASQLRWGRWRSDALSLLNKCSRYQSKKEVQ